MKFGFGEVVLAQAVVGSDTDLDNLLPFWLAYCGIQVYPRYNIYVIVNSPYQTSEI